MKQILVISGKGGTGKTTLTATFGQLAENVVLADCDVDAADLHLIATPESEVRKPEDFYSGSKFEVDRQWCSACGKCVDVCRWKAIDLTQAQPDRPEWKVAEIDPLICEGCGCCADVCPTQAIKEENKNVGRIFVSSTRFGDMVHGRLGIAESNSGKMVAKIREYAKETAQQRNADYVLIDGSPGIGCPVIASLAGVDAVVIITEPSLSGLHDLERIVSVCKHFNIPASIILNKFDLNNEISQRLYQRCSELRLEIIGKLPFDKSFVKATAESKTIIEYGSNNGLNQTVKDCWNKIKSC